MDLRSEVTAAHMQMEEMRKTLNDLVSKCRSADRVAANERDARVSMENQCSQQLERIRELERGIEQGADNIAELESRVQELRGVCYAAERGSIDAIVRQINRGDVVVDGVVLVQWDARAKTWTVVNAPDEHLSADVGQQLDLPRDKVQLVRVIMRDDAGSLIVSKLE
jgi:predicted RNase H-like nuclease (RuvC/YqgF family)